MRTIALILFSILSNFAFSQQSIIKDKFSQKIIQEDFDKQNPIFPTITGIDGKYAIIIDSLGYYGIGTSDSQHPFLIDWQNDLEAFELKLSIRLKDEDNSFVIQKIQGETGQILGIILKYNAEQQEALIFEINGVKQYRLSHLKNETMRSLTGPWQFSENLNRNDENEIMIKTKNNRYEFYINNKFAFRKNLERLKDDLNTGKFGFYLGNHSHVMINSFYISALKNYNGINKPFNLTQEDATALIKENQKLKNDFKKEKDNALKDATKAIKVLEKELKSANTINDSLKSEIEKYEPFKDLLNTNGDFMYTLTKDLKAQMEKNQILKNKNQLLIDSIDVLILRQDEFKLEYLKVLDSMMEKKDTLNEKK